MKPTMTLSAMWTSISIATALLAVVFLAVPPASAAGLLESAGKVTLLRVHDVGTKYGPPNDQIDVEAIVWLDTQPGKAFGFQLRDDSNRPARQGMLDLLRDAFAHNWTVTIDYLIDPGKNNGVILRVWITKPPSTTVGGVLHQ